MTDCVELDKCLACGGSSISAFVNLGSQPLANDYRKRVSRSQLYPLAVNVCADCYHSQLTHAVNPDLLYRNYLYVSGTTSTLMEYFDWFVGKVESDFDHKTLNVLDIASNDGSLLSRFAARSHHVLGVDPAENLAPVAISNGVPTVTGYWDQLTAEKIGRRFEAIVAMNVLGHVADPLGFLATCKASLRRNGKVYVQTSQCEMIERNEFDTIYHEHLSYFTAKSFIALAKRAGLKVLDVEKVPVHGTSYLWTLAIDGTESKSVSSLVDYETINGYYDSATYSSFNESLNSTALFVQQVIAEYADTGWACIGYGAAAKGNTLLNYADIHLDFIVDDNPLKIGLFTPGQNIPILNVEALASMNTPMCIVVLAWNFFDEIVERIKTQCGNGKYVLVRYFPNQEII